MHEELQKQIDKLDPDVQSLIFQKGFKSGLEHQRPSPETACAIKELRESNAKLFTMVESIHDSIHSEFGIITVLREIKSNTEKELTEIKGHTGRTNGRVGALENWKAGIVATIAMLSVGLPAISWYFIQKFDTLRETVITHIAQDKENFNKLNK
jgi:hypothetical protein